MPTAWGALLLTGLLAAAGWVGVRGLYPFLAPDQPVGHGVLVVEGWVGENGFERALAAYATGRYQRLVTSGGPIERGALFLRFDSYAAMAAAYLRARGVPEAALAVIPAPASAQDRTFLSAVSVRDWLAEQGLHPEGLDVVSQGPHARRTWRLYRQAFGDEVAVGIYAAPPEDYDAGAWWHLSGGTKDVLTEAIGWAWTACCFHPAARGSAEEKWGPAPALRE